MYSPYLTVAAVIAGVTLLQAASGLLLVLLPLRMAAEGFSLQSMGWVAAAHGAGFLAGCLIISRMVSAIGHVRAFAALAAALSAIALFFATFDSPAAWIALRFVPSTQSIATLWVRTSCRCFLHSGVSSRRAARPRNRSQRQFSSLDQGFGACA